MGKQWKQWETIFWGLKITADSECSHEIKRCLLLGRKVMTNLDIILKSRDVTLLTKVHLVKAMVSPVVMYGCWRWSSNTLATWCEEPTHWKRPWCWGRLRAGGEGGNRGQNGWTVSQTQCTWVWANSEIVKDREAWCVQSMGLQRVRHNWVTEQQQ